MVFPAETVLQRQFGTDPVGILRENRVLHGETVVVVRHLVDRRVMRDAEQAGQAERLREQLSKYDPSRRFRSALSERLEL